MPVARSRLFQNTPEKSAADLVRDLLRWQANLLERTGHQQESLVVILKTIELLDGTRQQLQNAVDWLLEKRAWSTIEEVARRFPERFDEGAVLLYRLAEAQLQNGRRDLAEGTAERAAKASPESHHEHILAAYSLQERGLFDWAEREYRYVIGAVPIGSQEGLQARLFFSEMLHDLQRDQDAAESLKDIVQAMDKDENIRYLIARFRREPGSLASRMHFFLSEHARVSGNAKEQIAALKKAVEFDSTDADVLIGMYRAQRKGPRVAQRDAGADRQGLPGFSRGRDG